MICVYAMVGLGPINFIFAFMMFLAPVAVGFFVARSLRYAYRWAAFVAMFGISAPLLIMAPELGNLGVAVVFLVACTISWPIAMGIVATFQLHHLTFRNLRIDAVKCVRFRSRKPPVTLSPSKLLSSMTLILAPFVFGLIVVGVFPVGWLKGVTVVFGTPGLAAYLWPIARRRWQTSAKEARLRDWRPPVLLLRSFKDDMLQLTPPWYRSAAGRAWNFEELLTGQLWTQGPVIAIGRPGEPVPPVGAAREYVSDEKWQSQAVRMMQDASWIVMIVGETEGLGWEIKRVQDLQMTEKLVLVFPPVPIAESASRWEAFCGHLEGTALAAPLRELPSSDLVMTRISNAGDVQAITVMRRRDIHAYQLGLAAAMQLRDDVT